MSQKLFILDTNVLLSDPFCILKFAEHNIGIPMPVLEELDRQKSSDRSISRDARAVIRQLDTSIRDEDPISSGVILPTGGKLYVLESVKMPEGEGIDATCTDDHILNCVLEAQKHSNKGIATLVTNDVCMRLKGKGAGIKFVQEYRNDIAVQNPDELPRGYVELPEGWFNTLGKYDIQAKSCGKTLIRESVLSDMLDGKPLGCNDWLINEADGIYARMEGIEETETVVEDPFIEFTLINAGQFMARKAVGVYPKDAAQAVALDALLDPDIDIVVINGLAGSGKTLLAMAAATEMIQGKKGYRYQDVIVSRSMDSQFAEIGFLPGNETEKTKPWLSGIIDNMEYIARASKNIKLHPSKSISSGEAEDAEDAFIHTKALNFMRGRSISHKIFVIDEVQNLTSSQIKTVLSRAGEHCKVVIMGSLNQIDSTIVSPRTSALTYATEKLHGQPFAKVITLDNVHRSVLAAFVEENF